MIAKALLALVTAATEPRTTVVGFTAADGARPRRPSGGSDLGGISPLAISPRQRLDDVLKAISGLPALLTDFSARAI